MSYASSFSHRYGTLTECASIQEQNIDRSMFIGQQLINVRGACPKEVVQPKCDELSRVCDMMSERLSRRLEILVKSRDLMERIEKV